MGESATCFYNLVSFGLCNALATFQKVVTKAFKPYLNKFMQVFLDDFNVYGNKKVHLEQLQKCLEECKLNGISLNLENCAFCVNSRILLRHIVCHDNLLVDPHKIIAITIMPTPMNPTKIKQFLGVASFYQHYFLDFANKAAPMCKLLKKDEKLLWT
jgi:hypothetical protein